MEHEQGKFSEEKEPWDLRTVATNKSNMQLLRALYTKISRDYTSFFSSVLEISSEDSELQRKAQQAHILAGRTSALLRSMLVSSVVNKKDEENLFLDVDKLNEYKRFFVEESFRNAELQEILDTVSGQVGISTADLSVTRKDVEHGVHQSRRSGPLSPGNLIPGILSGLHQGFRSGAGVAMFGPYSTLLSEFSGVAGKAAKKIQKLYHSRLIQKGRERISGIRPVTPRSSVVGRKKSFLTRGGVQESHVAYPRESSLELFFDKKAYQVRWTKEVLATLHEIAESKGKAASSSLKESMEDIIIGGVGASSLGKLASSGVAGSVVASLPVASLAAVFTAISAFALRTALGVGMYAPPSIAPDITERYKKENPVYEPSEPPVSEELYRIPKPETIDERIQKTPTPEIPSYLLEQTLEKKMRDLSEQLSRGTLAESPAPLKTSGVDTSMFSIPEFPGIEELTRQIERLIEQMKSQPSAVPQVSPNVHPNVYDSGDVLLLEHSKGLLNSR